MTARLGFSTVVAIALGIAGVLITERSGDPAVVVSAVEERLRAAFQPRALQTPPDLKDKFSEFVQVAPAWSEVQAIAAQLKTWQNRQIAEAKGLSLYESRPSDVYSFDWESRASRAGQAWQIEESSELVGRLVTAAAIGGGVGLAVTYGGLAACAWLWAAFLRRVREVSDAVRGK